MFASMECVSFRWFAIEDSISETSVERDRGKDLRSGGARAFRPVEQSIRNTEVLERR